MDPSGWVHISLDKDSHDNRGGTRREVRLRRWVGGRRGGIGVGSVVGGVGGKDEVGFWSTWLRGRDGGLA